MQIRSSLQPGASVELLDLMLTINKLMRCAAATAGSSAALLLP
jgi:hypothetical protein